MADIQLDYFTAAETEQYTFYRIPKALFTKSHFQALTCEAKVLYGMMLDRLGLSIRNQWFDSQGRAYIIFTVEDVMGVMGCQSQKASSAPDERAGYCRRNRADREKTDRAWQAKPNLCEKYYGKGNRRHGRQNGWRMPDAATYSR